MLLKRIIRWFLAVLAVSVAVAATASWIYRDQLSYWWSAPRMHYVDMPAIPGPTYLFPVAWAARPDFESRALLVPDGVDGEAAGPDALVDVFYIHPNAYWGPNWNGNYDDPDSVRLVDGQMLAMDLTAFNGCCRVFAPRYRQAHGIALDHPSGDGRQAIDLATVDIERAFRHYSVTEREGRPFIIVGHGQGAVLAMRLLDRRIDDEDPLFDGFVAAYVIGAGIPVDRFGTNWEQISVCETAAEIRCVVSWEAYTADADAAASPNVQEIWYDRHWTQLRDVETLCINPVTWTRGGAASADAGPISLAIDPGFVPARGITGTPRGNPDDFDTLPPLTAAFTSAECRDGKLRVTLADTAPVRGFGPGKGNLDQHAISLFWASIRENAALRAAAFLANAD